ncbi:ATP-dependent DNA helicase [Aphis craccivora]|uniref:ATP-dependent DNA helicase n=1 Tax=Aphis craccivora TaxID=307492 RepID=A0A6G0Z6D1_APHCR|nr:ATP-dependent DNA helicase [Aphis craccivora]
MWCCNIQFNNDIYNEALILIDNIILLILNNTNLELYKLPKPNRENATYDIPDDYLKEVTYDTTTLETFAPQTEKKCTERQNKMPLVEQENINICSQFNNCKYKSTEIIVIPVASCKISDTLLYNGKTAHSAFKLCGIPVFQMAQLTREVRWYALVDSTFFSV